MSATRRHVSSPPPDARSGYTMRGRQGHLIETIGRAIVGGTYAPGEVLPREVELTEQHGVSRTSVREAMKVLAAKGLVEIGPKVGTRVRAKELWNIFDSDLLTWTYEQGGRAELLGDLLELRQIIEPSAARLAATRATIQDLGVLERTASAMRESVDDHTQYADSDVTFHLAVYAAAHNVLLSRFGVLVADFMRLSFGLQQAATPRSLKDDAEQHEVIVDAINRGDSAAAAAAMLHVVLDGKRALATVLGESQGDGR